MIAPVAPRRARQYNTPAWSACQGKTVDMMRQDRESSCRDTRLSCRAATAYNGRLRLETEGDRSLVAHEGAWRHATDLTEPPPVPRLLGRGRPGALAGARGRGAAGEATSGPARGDRSGDARHELAPDLARAARRLRSSPLCDAEPKHRLRGQGIVEKATWPSARRLRVGRARCSNGPTSTPWSSRCPATGTPRPISRRWRAGKHLYAEKPLGLTAGRVRRSLIAEPPRRVPSWRVHVGFQRRSNPRYRDGVELVRRGELGPLIEGTRRLGQQQRPDERPRRLARPPRAVGRLDGRAGRARLGRLPLDRRRAARPGLRPGPARPLRRRRSPAAT